ncbi:hypothetical protein [Nocardioides marmorisolisilvae]|uniref:Uncharacterized protein n=1 Tax=Nocardioides marmorisolisilvae TaxID=1542737 RepID=A0A3N0DPT8_9ACTN|nr:hypothetical protein [Nocardioides marmorisolisilvae]RNL77669.1 hypothetical protein EFL95_16825 [Nocardioides marmorisolisilvae]
MPVKPLLAALTLVLAVGATGCGKDDPQPKADPTSSSSDQPTGTPTATDEPSDGSTPTSPAVGLPTDFPAQTEVPVVSGVVTSKNSGTQSTGRMGWQIELQAVGTRKGCFDRAAAALVAAGFAKQAAMTAGDTLQAQYTTKKWAVIISSRSDGSSCQLGYEVGQLAD